MQSAGREEGGRGRRRLLELHAWMSVLDSTSSGGWVGGGVRALNASRQPVPLLPYHSLRINR